MTRRGTPGQLLASMALLAATLVPAQVIRIGGTASNLADTQGAAVTVYQADAITQTSIGYAQGVRIGASREVESGPLSMTVGDSRLTLALPTDLPGDARTLVVRGALIQTLDRQHGLADTLSPSAGSLRASGSVFAGWTGDSYSSAFSSAVQPSRGITFATASVAMSDRLTLSAVAMQGPKSSLLASSAWQLRPKTIAAMTFGWSAGKPILQVSGRSSGESWRLESNYTSGELHLQPDPALASFKLERIGWNIVGSKHVRNWLWLDAARHELGTAQTVDGAASGVTAGRSVLYEAGGTVRWRGAQAGGRALHSISGQQTDHGLVFLAGWTARRWEIRGTAARNTTPDRIVHSSANIDTSQRLTANLKFAQGVNFANGAPNFDLGGTYEGRWGSLTISHHETYVPFGFDGGFHRVLAIGVRLHIRDTEMIMDQISSPGLQKEYDVTVDSFHGDSLGAAGLPASHMGSLPRFAVTGQVHTVDGVPVRGAAVQVGQQTVFTNSEGVFIARLTREQAVQVSTVPAAFLTSESYRDLSGSRTAQPHREETAEDIALTVERCTACNDDRIAFTQEELAPPTAKRTHSALWRAGMSIVALAKRMVRPAALHSSAA